MGTKPAWALLPWGWEGDVLPPGTLYLLHVKLSGAPGCPPCSCKDQAASLHRVNAVPLSPGGALGPVCVHGEDRGLRGRAYPNFSLACLPLCPSSPLTSTSTQRS